MAERRKYPNPEASLYERLEQAKVREPASEEDIRLLGKQVAALADAEQYGNKHSFSAKTAPTFGYTVMDIPKEYVPKDAMIDFNPAQRVNLQVNFDTADGTPTIEFNQMHNVGLVSANKSPAIIGIRVQYDLSLGQRSVQYSRINQGEIPLRPKQHSIISRGAAAQLRYALNRPELQPKKQIKKL